jgi:hypothetical protein
MARCCYVNVLRAGGEERNRRLKLGPFGLSGPTGRKHLLSHEDRDRERGSVLRAGHPGVTAVRHGTHCTRVRSS